MKRDLVLLLVLCVAGAGALMYTHQKAPAPAIEQVSSALVAATSTSLGAPVETPAETPVASSTKSADAPAAPAKAKPATAPVQTAPKEQAADSSIATRIQNPYSTAPGSVQDTNAAARAALVNILCQQRAGSLRPISGSGVIIDPRGVILTNAHVAQYVLLSESPQIDLSCFIRTGAPARSQWVASVLYIPSVWVAKHVTDINADHPTGTGEHDYALLYITGAIDGGSLPASFPYLSPDTRDGIAFTSDQVLAASYPAEFSGGIATESGLYPSSSQTTVGTLLTFSSDTIDLISLGGIIEAQSGSSGGAVVNLWQKLVAIIVTTSTGATTGSRDLRGLTLGYIDRDLKALTGSGLSNTLKGDLKQKTEDFTTKVAPLLIQKYVTQLSGS